MPVYAYRALNPQGKTIRGLVDAEGPAKARQKIRADGLHPIEVHLTEKNRRGSGPLTRPRRAMRLKIGRLRLLADTTRHIATLLAAGLPLVTVLATLQEQSDDQDFGRLLALIREEVTSGESLAGALSLHPEVFPTDYIHLVKAGELAGALDQVLARLADNLELRLSRRAKISASLAYPAFMTVVGLSVLFFLLSFIVPTLTGLFSTLGAALPWPTRLLLAVSGFFSKFWWLILLAAVGLILLLAHLLKNEKTFRRVEVWLFQVPLFGPLTQRLRLAQVFRGLAVMTGGGVPLTSALEVTAKGLGRSSYGQALDLAVDLVGQGRTLAASFEASGLFPPVSRRMVAVGEASGTLPEMLDRVARNYEQETDRFLATLTSMVEPVIILIMGLLVGFVVMAVLIPIFDLSGLVK